MTPRFTNQNRGRVVKNSSVTPGATTFELAGGLTQQDAGSTVAVESGTLLIMGTLTQSGGDVSVSQGTSLTVTDTYTASAGTITDYGTLTTSNGLTMQSGSSFSGAGSVIANVSNAGTFVTGAADGSSTGTVSVTGNYTQTAGATTVNGEFDVSGTFEQDGGTVTVPQSQGIFNAGAFVQTAGDFSIYFTNACSVSGSYTMTGGTTEFYYSGGTLGGPMALNGGVFQLSSATTLTVSGGVSIGSAGTLDLFGGTLAANVSNAGTLSLDASSSTKQITGNYTQLSTGQLIIAGNSSSYGHLTITGTATLAGTFVFDMGGSYGGSPGDNFDLISYSSYSGAFTTLTLPTLTNPYANGWSARYNDPSYPNAFSLWVV